jgi:hypothetical protein
MGGFVSKEGDLSQYIAEIEKNVTKLPSFGSNSSSINIGSGPATGFSLSKALVAILSMVLIVGIFLTLIHFFVTPIFKFRPGQKGIIPINVTPDSTSYWTDTSSTTVPTPILMKDSAIANSAAEYSMTLDVFMNNPTQFAQNKGYRPIFVRSAKSEYVLPTDPTIENAQTFFQQFAQAYNLAIFFDKDTNDLIVSTMTVNNDQINVRVENVPTRQPFRIGVVLGNTVMDVYINGRLYRSVIYNSMPVFLATPIILGPDPRLGSMVQVRLLQLWPRPLTPGELRDMIPPLSKFDGTDLQDTVTCSILPSLSQTLDSSTTAATAALKNLSTD